MQNSYFLQASQAKIVHGPGRRPTSNQIFLTFAGPDDMLFSYVTEGDVVADDAAHRPRQFPRARSSELSRVLLPLLEAAIDENRAELKKLWRISS